MLTTLPRYQVARSFGKTPPLPFNYTFIMTGLCNSRCLTCNIYKNRDTHDLSLEEWKKVFESIGHSPFWCTLSGGEPFMRKDLTEIHHALCETCKPSIVNIPTNSLTTRTPEYVWEMALRHPDIRLVINVSLDHCDPQKNDVIRGVPGHYKRALKNFQALKELNLASTTIGIHTVISKHNVKDFPQIAEAFLELSPDQFICEVAEERVELGTIGAGITPSADEYIEAISGLRERMKASESYQGLGKLTRAFRLHYYANTIKYLQERTQPIPCYAGYASCQINYEGTVWPCCIEAKPLGNLRDTDYDFATIWQSGLAAQARERIRKGECACPLANASYSNMLLNPQSLVRVGRNVLG